MTLVGSLGHWAYAIIFVVVCLESAAFLGFLMPGESLVFLGGFLASQGVLHLRTLIGLVAIAAVIGDSVGYELGRWLGRGWLLRLERRLGMSPHHLQQVETFFARYGGKTVFFARFSVFFRIMVPFVAGAVRLPYREFLAYNVAGGILWSIGAVLIGYLAGESWPVVEHWIGRAGAILAIVVVVLVILAWLWRWEWR